MEVDGDAGQQAARSDNIELTGTDLRNLEVAAISKTNGVDGIDNPAFSVSESEEFKHRPVANGTEPTDGRNGERRTTSFKRVIIIEKDWGSGTEKTSPHPEPPVIAEEVTAAVEDGDQHIKSDDTEQLHESSELTNGHDDEDLFGGPPSESSEPPATLEVDPPTTLDVDTPTTLEVDTPTTPEVVALQADGGRPDIHVLEEAEGPASEETLVVGDEVDAAIVAKVDDATVAEDVDTATAEDVPEVIDDGRCWRADGSVKIPMADHGPASEPPITVPTLLISTVRRHPHAIAMASKVNTRWVKWTYRQYLDDVLAVAKAFIKLGLEPAHSVGIIGFNSPQWFVAEIAAIFAGGLAVGIYTTNTPEAVGYVARHSKANILVVEDDAQLEKVLAVRDTLPDLKAIIQYRGRPKTEGIYAWTELPDIGRPVPDMQLEERIQALSPNKACVIIYTSGTTGQPKGVMLSHDNLTWTARMAVRHCRFKWGSEVAISYLPLSHIAAQLVDVFMPMTGAFTIYFAQPDALKGSLGDTLREVRPTVFLAVPRVWEKMQDKLMAIGRTTKGCKRKIATWAKGIGLRGNLARMRRQRKPLMFGLANALVFKKIKKAMGLDRCHHFYSGAAPISRETLEYFMSLNIVITEIYGMSEITGPQTIGVPWSFLLGSVGSTVVGLETKLLNTEEDGTGEICMRGRNVFMGYLNEEGKTKETIDDDGFVHSGDLGRFDPTGTFLHITGRIKELLITAGGENIAPVLIEDSVKAALPCVSNCMLIGDKRKFLSLLLTIRSVVDADTLVPEDRLDPVAIEWCRDLGCHNVTTVSAILNGTDERIMKAIQAGIDVANTKAISRAQKIQKWTVLPQDFSIPGDELGPTLKLKRPVVLQKYHDTIEAFYSET